MEQKKRIEYIDALRGFTMILVVYQHLETYGCHMPETIICRLFMNFRLPLFFFISGYLAYKASQQWDAKSLYNNILKKAKIQLIPTLIFGLIYTYFVANATFTTFVKSPSKLGYWFTLVLLCFFIIYYIISYIYNKFSKTRSLNMGVVITLCVVSIALYCAKLIFRFTPSLNTLYDTLSLYYVFTFFPFFAFGIIAKIYNKEFNKLFNHSLYSAIIIILFITIFIFRTVDGLIPHSINTIIDPLLMILNGIFGITIVYNFFRKYQTSFSQQTRLGKTLQYIGHRTFDIYLLHFILIPDLTPFAQYLNSSSTTVVGLFMGIIIALMVIAVCLVISNTIRLSPILAHYLFGAKKQ